MQELTIIFRTLADEARLRILSLLFASGELCVCDIESTLGFTQTKVSRHMKYLKRAGLVDDRKHGRWVLYAIAQPKTQHQRIIIQNVHEILSARKETLRDKAKLMKQVNDGCCATYVHVKPYPAPKNITHN